MCKVSKRKSGQNLRDWYLCLTSMLCLLRKYSSAFSCGNKYIDVSEIEVKNASLNFFYTFKNASSNF